MIKSFDGPTDWAAAYPGAPGVRFLVPLSRSFRFQAMGRITEGEWTPINFIPRLSLGLEFFYMGNKYDSAVYLEMMKLRDYTPPPPGGGIAPPTYHFGIFDYSLNECDVFDSVIVTFHYPNPIPGPGYELRLSRGVLTVSGNPNTF